MALLALCAQAGWAAGWGQAELTQSASLLWCPFAKGCLSCPLCPVPPEFIQGSGSTTNISVPLHGTLALSCEATGVPLPTVTWSWQGSPVSPGEHTQVLSGQGWDVDAGRGGSLGDRFCPKADGFKHGGAPALLLPGPGP